MRVAFRADASSKIGTGHIMRCLIIAHQLRTLGHSVSFITRTLQGNLVEHLLSKGFDVVSLPYQSRFDAKEPEALYLDWEIDAEETIDQMGPSVDWLIVDHYALDERWEARLRAKTDCIMVIDDLANRKHDCDLLLDQNLYPDMDTRYRELIPQACRVLLGPRYALLREEFYRVRDTLVKPNDKPQRVLVFFGGADSTNQTEKAIYALRQVNSSSLSIDVILGPSNLNRAMIESKMNDLRNARLHVSVADMAKRMADADLFIGTGGITSWERCFLGLPSITICTATNHEAQLAELGARGATWFLGNAATVTPEDIAASVCKLIERPNLLVEMRESAASLMDGHSRDTLIQHLKGGYNVC